MTPTLKSLRNPHAKRVGQVHYVHFVTRGDSVTVLTDDCGFEGQSVMTAERATQEYDQYVAWGFTAYESPYAQQVLHRAS